MNLTTVKTNNASAGFSSVGADYEKGIGKAQALKLAGMYPLPAMGNELLIAITAKRDRLYLANLSGSFFLRCYSWPVANWPDVFGVKVL